MISDTTRSGVSPAASGPAVSIDLEAQPEAPSPTRILLVEDNERLRGTTERLLRLLGYEVSATAGACEAMAALEQGQHFDLVFSDVGLPGAMNGVQLVQAMQARDRELKAVLTSGYSENVDTVGEVDRLRLPMIRKPYRKADLAACLLAALGAG